MAKQGFKQAGNFLITELSATGAPLTSGMVTKTLSGTDYRFIHNNGVNCIYMGISAGPATITNATDGVNNAGFGTSALASLDTSAGTGQASGMTAAGAFALTSATSAQSCNAIGANALYYVTTGSQNTALGTNTGMTAATGGITTGANNTLLGYNAGSAYRSSESSNILIGSGVTGTVGESNVLRIGAGTGTGTGQLNQANIAGIFGKTSSTGTQVYVNSSDVLGTTTSSRRYKENIKPLTDDESARLYKLNPVTFNYKADDAKEYCYGLIAEEVEKVMPDMVIYDKKGQIETVKYHFLVPMLLKEIQNIRKEIDKLKKK